MTALKSSPHNFRSPPVYETALAVQFEELSSFRTIHFGLFYQSIADRFPVAEDHPRADPIVETFPIVPKRMAFAIAKSGPERVWFRDKADGTLLLQVQPDRFGLNWRRKSEQEEYPRFEQNGPLFLEEFRRFEEFCDGQALGMVRPNLCEVVYVNHVFPRGDESAVECMEGILAGVSVKLDNWGMSPELATFNRVYQIGDRKGRLYFEASIGRHQERGDFVVLKITARVVHRDGDELVTNLQMAHDSVTDGFVAITTADAKDKRWRKNT